MGNGDGHEDLLGRVDELQNAVMVPNSSLLSASEDARERAFDPAIHPFHKKMDARVKPAHDR
jgi:hypothetical protein